MMRGHLIRSLTVVLLGCAAAFAANGAAAQVGQVISVQGTALVERAGKPARVLGAGEAIEQKDVISVAQNSHAVLEFRDKTRITLRPNTVFRVETYSETAPQAMVLGLTKGGFRAVTGDMAKQNPGSVRFQTENVVLAIRGTEFDARLCEDDCAADDRAKPAVRAVARAVGRLIEIKGTVTAGDGKGAARELVAGAVLYEGEMLATGVDSNALVAFRDGSRVTLMGESRLTITRFDFDEATPDKGRARMKLASGSAHVLTGQLARLGVDAFLFDTGAGTIHTPGAGFSVGTQRSAGQSRPVPSGQLPLTYANARAWTGSSGAAQTQSDAVTVAAAGSDAGANPDDVIVVHTWDGTIIIQTATERIEIPKTATLAIAIVDGKITFLPTPPPSLVQTVRLDLVNIDPSTFGPQGPAPERGLYVWVRDGAVTLGLGAKVVELKAGSAARITNTIALLDGIPNFMRFDFTPRPGGTLPPQVPRFFRGPDGSINRMCR